MTGRSEAVRASLRDYALILVSTALAAAGQLLMKSGAVAAPQGGLAATLGASLAEPLVLAGVSAYAISSVVWLIVLSRVPLSIAYPFAALSYVVVVAVAFFSGETVTALRWAGVGFIVAGVWLVAAGAHGPVGDEGPAA